MKPYGNKRCENASCRAGCCTFGTVKTNSYHRPSKALLRRGKKRARQTGRKEINETFYT